MIVWCSGRCMANMSVYLAGPITGLTYDEANDWRNKAREYLAQFNIVAFSPLRGKAYLKNLGELTATAEEEGKAGVLSTPKAIMARDYRDATSCDVLFVNLLGATRVSIGTVMEIAWVYQLHKPIVLVMEPGNVHEHAMITETLGFRVSTIEEGLAVCASILDPVGTI